MISATELTHETTSLQTTKLVPFAEFVAAVMSSSATCITIETGMAFATRLVEERRS